MPNSVAIGDFNLDSKPDVVTANQGSSSLSVLLGKGDGTFHAEVAAAAGSSTAAVAMADFNRDGKPDLVAVDESGGSLVVLLGNGNGTFQANQRFSVGISPNFVEAGDLNIDGIPDLVSANAQSNTLSVLFGNGDGAFQAKIDIESGTSPHSLVAADFDRDNKPDLVAANADSLTVLINQPFSDAALDLSSAHDGKWNNPTTWQQCRVPTPNDTVTINPDDKVTLDSPAAVKSLTVVEGQLFTTTSGNLIVEGDLINNGFFGPGGSTVQIGGSFTINGGFETGSGSHLIISGDFINNQDYPILLSSSTMQVNGNLINNGSFYSMNSSLYVRGDFTSQESFLDDSGTVIFDGTGVQTLSITGGLGFYNIIVGQNSILTTASHAGYSGVMTNNGWISETQSIDGWGADYGLTGAKISINYRGTLSSVEIRRHDTSHPNAPAGHQTGKYWQLIPNDGASGFYVELTFYPTFTPNANDGVCRYTGSDWDCGVNDITSYSITRKGVTAFSDWTILHGSTSSVSVSSNSASSTYGDNVTLTATVTSPDSTPAGSVAFYDNDNLLGSATLNNGTATYSTAALSAGSHWITATYAGQGLLFNSTGTLAGGLEVAKANLTVRADDSTRIYGTANPTFSGAIAGNKNGDIFRATYYSSATVTSWVGSNYSIVPTIYDSTPPKLRNYNVTFTNGSLTITQAPLEIIADNASRTYGAADPSFTGKIKGLMNGDGITAIYHANASLASSTGQYDIIPTVVNSTPSRLANYKVTSTNGSLTITQAPLEIIADNASRTYGAADPSFTGKIKGLMNGDDITAIYHANASLASSAGQYDIIPTVVDSIPSRLANYKVTSTNGTLTIDKAVLTFTADDKARSSGSPNPSFTFQVSGYVNGDERKPNVYSGVPELMTIAAPTSGAGVYPIVITNGNLISTNYTFALVNGNLTITDFRIMLPWIIGN